MATMITLKMIEIHLTGSKVKVTRVAVNNRNKVIDTVRIAPKIMSKVTVTSLRVHTHNHRASNQVSLILKVNLSKILNLVLKVKSVHKIILLKIRIIFRAVKIKRKN